MKQWTRTWLGLGAALALLAAVGTRRAEAAAQDSDSLTIRISPNVDVGVDVDTASARFNDADSGGDLDIPLDLNTTAFLIAPASVTILGNVNNQEVRLTAVGLDSWSVDTDETIGLDSVQLYALFATSKSSRPVESEFAQGGDGRHLIRFGAADKLAGETFGSENNDLIGNQFEIANASMSGGADMDGLAVGNLRQLWLRVDTPGSTSSDQAQRLTVTLTAESGTNQ